MRSDSSRLATFTCLYVLIKELNFQGIKSESLAEVQFVIGSCRLFSQSNYLDMYNKECDWLILACFLSEQYTADATSPPLGNKAWFENSANAWGNYWIPCNRSRVVMLQEEESSLTLNEINRTPT